MLSGATAQVGFWIYRRNAHTAHEPLNALAVDGIAPAVEKNRHTLAPQFRTLRIQLVDSMHERKVLLAFAQRRMIPRRACQS